MVPCSTQARRLQASVKPEILLPYIPVVLDPEKGAVLLTSVLSFSKEHEELVERSEYVFNLVLF